MLERAFWLTLLAMQLVTSLLVLRFTTNIVGVSRFSTIKSSLMVGTAALIDALVIRFSTLIGLKLLWAIPIGFLILPFAYFVVLRAIGALSTFHAIKTLALLAAFSAAIFGGQLLALRAVYAPYSIPTNGMAPTIKGRHFDGTCPVCGGKTVLPVRPKLDGRSFEAGDDGICEQCFATNPAAPSNNELKVGDHLLVNRLAQVRRWDIVVFRLPNEPSQFYVQRLVGMPGELLEIQNGSILINGAKSAPPPEISQLTWHEPSRSVAMPAEIYGIRGQPIRLGSGEYFMLGDNSLNSYDSRYWGPVPHRNLVGVVDCVHFPPRSWRLFPRHK